MGLQNDNGRDSKTVKTEIQPLRLQLQMFFKKYKNENEEVQYWRDYNVYDKKWSLLEDDVGKSE